jgi:tetratricopeptide (TPR) repeat protein
MASLSFAQSASVVKAYELYTQGEYVLASKSIDQAVKEEESMNDPLAWQLRAIIYFDMFDHIDKKTSVSESRVISLQSTLRSMELDGDKEFYDQNILLLDRLSSSYYNDAVIALKNMDPKDPYFAKNSFEEYIRIQKIAHPDINLEDKKIDFYRAQATAFGNIYYSHQEDTEEFFDMTLESLHSALAIDSMNYGANYNLSIYLYNKGADIIESINSEFDIKTLMFIQKDGIELFKEALPFMERAHQLRPREETLKGLKLIYRSLNEIEKSEYYSNELELFLENKPE